MLSQSLPFNLLTTFGTSESYTDHQWYFPWPMSSLPVAVAFRVLLELVLFWNMMVSLIMCHYVANLQYDHWFPLMTPTYWVFCWMVFCVHFVWHILEFSSGSRHFSLWPIVRHYRVGLNVLYSTLFLSTLSESFVRNCDLLWLHWAHCCLDHSCTHSYRNGFIVVFSPMVFFWLGFHVKILCARYFDIDIIYFSRISTASASSTFNFNSYFS